VRWFKDGRPKANVGVGALDRDTLEDLLAAVVSAVGGGYVHGNRPLPVPIGFTFGSITQ